MSRNVCTALFALLGLGLSLTIRRLRRVDAELARLRAQTPPATVAPTSAPPTFAASGPDMSAEWEQAILPMDS